MEKQTGEGAHWPESQSFNSQSLDQASGSKAVDNRDFQTVWRCLKDKDELRIRSSAISSLGIELLLVPGTSVEDVPWFSQS